MTSLTYTLFTFSHGGKQNKQGGLSLFDAASAPFKFQIGMAVRYFEQHSFFSFFLSKELFWLIECSDGLSECE